MDMSNKTNTSKSTDNDLKMKGDLNNSTQNNDCPYPLDIIIQNIQHVVEDQIAKKEIQTKQINHAFKKQGFKVHERENGADLEFVSCEPENDEINKIAENDKIGEKVAEKKKFKKGHKRACSMPNSKALDEAILVVAEDISKQEGQNKRHVVRYRLHSYKTTPINDALISNFIETTNACPEEDEIDVVYDEDEITRINENEPHILGFPLARRVWQKRYQVQNFDLLPSWLQDNEFLKTGHRPPLPSFTSCIQSIFQLHTETGNIWTHLYGFIAFIGITIYFLFYPNEMLNWKDKLVFSCFFFGAIFCLGLSFSFHTVQCHSQNVGKLFSKLDYSGITFLIVGSFIPFMYYGFYCRTMAMLTYVTMITSLGIAALIVSLFDKFASPKYRALRAIVFAAMGLSGVVPVLHLWITDGLEHLIKYDFVHWTVLMALFYLVGAAIYAFRFPERCCPGRYDLFFHSHQLFHVFVVFAALSHFYGISRMSVERLQQGSCSEQLILRYGTDEYMDFFDRKLRSYLF